MGSFVTRVRALALTLGAPGLFILSFLDSSFLSLPEATDLMLIWMVTQHRNRLLLYAGSATVGSIIGCFALYEIGRTGGEALLRSRMRSGALERASRLFQRFGLMSVLIPAILPPPTPFKAFVLLAGVAGVSRAEFSAAVGLGRGVRYFGEGLLAAAYGEQAMDFVRRNGRTVSLWVAGLLILGLAAYVVRVKARNREVR
jgi:membrane protein YqaA with SNARE-associated domain